MKRINANGKKYRNGVGKHMRVCCLVMIIAIALLLFPFGSVRAIEITEDISVDTIWTADLSPYIITQNISIDRDATLAIEPGVMIRFKRVTEPSDGWRILVNGTLQAQGSPSDPIIFTTEEKGHYWGHIEFTEESTPWDDANARGCIFNHCIIEYAGNGPIGTYGRASVKAISASPSIQGNIIRYSYTDSNSYSDGILAYGGSQNIKDNRIHHTKCGIKLISPEGGWVENNYLIHNEQGIHLESGSNTILIRENTILGTSSNIYGNCMNIELAYHDNLASYTWEQIRDPNDPDDPSVTLSNPNTRQPSFIAPDTSVDKTLTFQLTVTDKGGLIAVDTVTVNVQGENHKPVADAGADQTVYEGERVVLDGYNSIDPDGEIAAYAWEQTSDPNNLVSLSDPNSEHCTFIAPTGVGPYGKTLVFQLTVTDGVDPDLKSMDTVHIKIKEADTNERPVADAGPEITVTEGNPVSLDGKASYDPEGEIISWLWQQVEEDGVPQVTISNPTSHTVGFTAPEVDYKGKSLVFQLTVTDGIFQESSDPVIVNVMDTDPNTRNHPPQQVDAGLDQEVDEGQTVNLHGSAFDPDGSLDIYSYTWTKVSGPSVTLPGGITADRSFKAPEVTQDEELVFRLTVTDKRGMKSADEMKVTVKWINQAPTANAGENQTVEEGIKVLLDGSGSSDPDDGIASYLWEKISGPEVALSNNSVVTPTFRAPAVSSNEQIIFRLTVTDTDPNSSDAAFVTVNVRPQNDLPVADAGPDQAVTPGDRVTLDGSGSYDPEDPNNGIVSYLWEQSSGVKVTLYDPTSSKPNFLAPSIGTDPNATDFLTLTFLLTVGDKNGQEASDTVSVNVVEDMGNQIPAADAGLEQTVTVGATVTLDGSKSADPDTTSVIEISENDLINNESIDDDGQYFGNALAVTRKNRANADLSFISNNMEKITGNYMVYLYNWTEETPTPLDMTGNWWGTDLPSEIEAMIYDYDRDEYVPQVTISPALDYEPVDTGSDLSYPPMAVAGEDQTLDPDETVILNASGTFDPDDILTYEWQQTEGETVNLMNAGSVSASFIAPYPEDTDFKFTLTVTDGQGFYDTDEITITVNPEKADATLRTSSGCFIAVSDSDYAF